MEKYDYYYHVKRDTKKYVGSEVNINEWVGDAEGLEEYLNDTLFTSDDVTGNASGSYFCNCWKAEEALAHNWDLLAEALEALGCSSINIITKGVEWCDVTVRCYLLGQAIYEVVSELNL